MLIGDALFNSSFDMSFYAIYNSARKDTLFFRDVQEKTLCEVIFLVYSAECKGGDLLGELPPSTQQTGGKCLNMIGN